MENKRLKSLVDSYRTQFHELVGHAEAGEDPHEARKQILDLASRLAAREPSMVHASSRDTAALRDRFFSQFEGEQQSFAEELLKLARASYRLRDDDNIYLGQVKKEVTRARNEAIERLLRRGIEYAESLATEELIACLHDAQYTPARPPESMEKPPREVRHVFARQLTGQPASPGIAKGEARVVQSPADLHQFQAGEVLVCDAVSPEMTFVVPLAAAIVERRGGMLIHGAIIAREYGIPCVTGVPDVGSFVQTGKRLTVDGYLGIVIVS
jgi:pyruvate,water dikinase